jgi:hypothetical protein
LQVYSLLLTVAATAVVLFSAHLRGLLRRASDGAGYGADFVFGGGVLCSAWLLIAAGFIIKGAVMVAASLVSGSPTWPSYPATSVGRPGRSSACY